jgi:hypothetical protein
MDLGKLLENIRKQLSGEINDKIRSAEKSMPEQ